MARLSGVISLLFLTVGRSAAAQFVTIHRHAAGAGGLFVNAYLVETPRGVVAVDATLTESDSRALRAKLDSLHKPLLAVLLTHGHPDHYNGVTNLIAGLDVPVLATAGVDSVIRANDAAKEQQWRPLFKDEWPARRTFPTRIVTDGEVVTLDGVRFTVRDLGRGESHHDSYWTVRGEPQPEFLGHWEIRPGAQAVFVGDLVLNDVHAYTADGHTTEWLQSLKRVHGRLLSDAIVLPGHGPPGGRALLQWQQRYLTTYRSAVAELTRNGAALDDSAKARLIVRMKQFLPTDRLEFLIGLGADAVAAELHR